MEIISGGSALCNVRRREEEEEEEEEEEIGNSIQI